MDTKLIPTKKSRKLRKQVVDKTGFEADELLAAPVKPPELQNVRRSISPLQLAIILLGFACALVGVVIIIATLSFWGVVLACIGAAAVAAATLVRF